MNKDLERRIALNLVKNGANIKDELFQSLYNDKEFMIETLKINKDISGVFQFASDELKNDKSVVLQAVSINGYSLRYASDRLRADFRCGFNCN